MFVVFANIGPSRTIFPLIIDAALMVAKLHDAIEAHERKHKDSSDSNSVGPAGVEETKKKKKEDDNQLLGWSAATASKPAPIQYVDEDDRERDHADRRPAAATANEEVEVHPGVQTQADVIAREVLVAHVNALTNVFHRVLGSVPGPIILAALVDHTALPRSWSFFIVGFIAMCFGALGAYMSWAESPERRRPIQPASADDGRSKRRRDQEEKEEAKPKERIVYVDGVGADGGSRPRGKDEAESGEAASSAATPSGPRKIDDDDI
jgi:hypothetical protein